MINKIIWLFKDVKQNTNWNFILLVLLVNNICEIDNIIFKHNFQSFIFSNLVILLMVSYAYFVNKCKIY
jgi:hypothetical protein